MTHAIIGTKNLATVSFEFMTMCGQVSLGTKRTSECLDMKHILCKNHSFIEYTLYLVPEGKLLVSR